jgi:hypothetical protein
MSRVAQRIEEWKRKIVDLSRRNRSLYFSRKRASIVKLVEPTIAEIFDRLVITEKPWQFFMPPEALEATGSRKDPSFSEPLFLEQIPLDHSNEERDGEGLADRSDRL